MKILAKVKKSANKLICLNIKQIYFDSIPLEALFQDLATVGLVPLQEDGLQWAGILCGAEGQVYFELAARSTALVRDYGTTYTPSGNCALCLSWYKMQSGRYEIVAYVS